MVNIEFLYFRGCPGEEAAFGLLQRALAEQKTAAAVERIEVPGPETAEQFRFIGSPSIRIDGIDLEGEGTETSLGYGWRCRQYSESEPGHPRAVPSLELIRRRLLERLGEGESDGG